MTIKKSDEVLKIIEEQKFMLKNIYEKEMIKALSNVECKCDETLAHLKKIKKVMDFLHSEEELKINEIYQELLEKIGIIDKIIKEEKISYLNKQEKVNNINSGTSLKKE